MGIEVEVLNARRAAIARVIELITELCRDGGCIVGMGTGSTVAQLIEEVVKKDLLNLLRRSLVACSSSDTLLRLSRYGVPCMDVLSILSYDRLDVYVDSADEVDERCFMIKGGGGALLKEKILTELARTRLFIVDHLKLSPLIGSRSKLPVEIVPCAYPLVAKKLRNLGINFELRMSLKRRGPVITDCGNYLLDVETGPMEDPSSIERGLKSITGVIETGLFHPHHVTEIIIGLKNGEVRVLRPST